MKVIEIVPRSRMRLYDDLVAKEADIREKGRGTFFRAGRNDDIVLVQTNPLVSNKTPRTAREILNRVNEITFNASLQSELRAIGFVSRQRQSGLLGCWIGRSAKPVRIHRIAADKELKKLSSSSKFTVDWSFFRHLRDVGRKAAEEFLRKDFGAIGRRGTLDLRKDAA